MFRLSMAAAVLPIFVAAVRDGLNGWYPSFDAATTVLRTRDVISAHPPLVGMWASVSSKVGVATYFPGAVQLYALALPVHFLGNSWGTLLGMALLNSVWVLLASWLISRRVGPQLATFGCLAFATLVWTMGSELVVDISPMQMVTIPFALFLVAVWSVADGDLVAVPVLALVANFLVLGHLVLTLLVPTIGLCAVLGLVLALRRDRRDRPDAWPTVRRRLLRVLGLSAAITVVLWIAPLYQQLTHRPGNLTNLWRASRADLHSSVSFGKAIQVVIGILTVPPFWLRDSFTTVTLNRGPHLDGVRIALGLGVIAVLSSLTWLAARRRDRTVLTMLGVAVAAIVMSLVNITKAPADYGFKRQYFRSLWAVAMFVWMTVAIAAIRSMPAWRRTTHWPRVGAVGAALTLVVAGFALPHKDPGPGTNGTTDPAAILDRKLLGPAVHALKGRGKVKVVPAGSFTSYGMTAALVLALDTAGVDVCVSASWVDQYGDGRTCGPAGPDVVVHVSSSVRPLEEGDEVIGEASAGSPEEQQELATLTREIRSWLADQDGLTFTAAKRDQLAERFGDTIAQDVEERSLAPATGDLRPLASDVTFATLVRGSAMVRDDGRVESGIETGDLPGSDLLRWAELVTEADNGYTARISASAANS